MIGDKLPERLSSRLILTEAGCWEWTGGKQTKGYGQTSYRNHRWRTHRLMYVLNVGPIPDGKMVCHTCDNRPCCNPAHLYLGDGFDNMRDASRRGRINFQKWTHCKNGHPLDVYGKFRGEKNPRVCQMCARIRQRIYAGWPRELAESMPVTPKGYRPVGGDFTRDRKKPKRKSLERGSGNG